MLPGVMQGPSKAQIEEQKAVQEHANAMMVRTNACSIAANYLQHEPWDADKLLTIAQRMQSLLKANRCAR